jgi:ABC-type branched-subunit amino acid transport system ATPase component
VFVVSAVLAGLSGFFFAHQSGYISSDAFGLDRSIALLIAVVIGGLGRAYGAILGATILILLNQLTAGLYEFSYFIFGGILLLVMLFFPAGAAGALERPIATRSARKASRAARDAAGAVGNAVAQDGLPPMAGARHVGDGPILSLQGITKSYSGVAALSDLSLDVMPGTVHAVIGPNGAGKSTLVNVLSGLYRPDSGSIRFRGHDVTQLAPHRRAELGMTRTFQNLQLIGTLTVAENVMLGLRDRRGFLGGWFGWLASDAEERAEREAAMRLLRFLRIERFADALPGDLAYGHRKLCELARALAQQPTMLLLDEPIAGLNEEEAREVMARIRGLKALGVTVLLIEHNMTFVMELSDTVSVLDYGRKIAEGTPAQVRANKEVITAYLGAEASA